MALIISDGVHSEQVSKKIAHKYGECSKIIKRKLEKSFGSEIESHEEVTKQAKLNNDIERQVPV